MVHKALALDGVDPVDHLVHAPRAQGGHVENLGLAPLEQPRAVGGGDDLDLGGERTEVIRPTAIDPDTLVDDPGPDHPLGDRPDGRPDLTFGAVHLDKAGKDLLDEGGLERRLSLPPLGLVSDGLGFGDPVTSDSRDRFEDLIAVVGRDLVVHGLRSTDRLHEGQLQFDDLPDVGFGELEALSQDGLVDLWGAGLVDIPGRLGATGLNHHHGHVAVVKQTSGHHHLERRLGALLEGGVGNPLTGRRPGDAHRPNRPVERDVGQHQRR